MLSYTIVFSFFLVTSTGFPWNEIGRGGRIINGTNVKPGQYPFMVSLQYRSRHNCGATIVNSCYVLTAAHCVKTVPVQDLSVLAGTITLSSGGNKIAVEKTIVHEEYNPGDMYRNDIAVVKLVRSLTFDENIKPISLPEHMKPIVEDLPATLIGWGYNYTGGETMDILQEVQLNVYSDEECRSLHAHKIHDSNVCAGVPNGGKGQCTNDSGGPLIVNGTQVGIVSWSLKPCAEGPKPGVFTEVSYYADWITKMTDGTCT